MNGPTQRVTATLLVVLQTIGYIIILMPPAALAQQAKAGDPLTLPRYRVEVLIFRHLEQSLTTEEFEAHPDPFLPPNFDVNALGETPDTPTQRETTGMASATGNRSRCCFRRIPPAGPAPKPTQFCAAGGGAIQTNQSLGQAQPNRSLRASFAYCLVAIRAPGGRSCPIRPGNYRCGYGYHHWHPDTVQTEIPAP